MEVAEVTPENMLFTGCISFIASCMEKVINTQERRYLGFTSVELVDGIADLAVNDDNKQKV